MPTKQKEVQIDIINRLLIAGLLASGFIILFVSLYRQVRPPVAVRREPIEIFVGEPQELAIFLMGESSYLYSKDIDGNHHIINYLNDYLSSRSECEYSISSPSITEFNDSYFRIWGDPFERDDNGIPIAPIDQDINTVPMFIAAKDFVANAKAAGKIPVVVMAHGANESKDIVDNQNTQKTLDKFHQYLNSDKSALENLGAYVIMATPVKGCPFDIRHYDPEGTLKDLANGVKNQYANVADVYGLFDAYSCSDTQACPGPDECQTRCLINVNPFNSPGFPSRTCQEDYAHPNSDGYTMMAKAIGDQILELNLCAPEETEPTNTPAPEASSSPTPTTEPTATPTPISEQDEQSLKKGDLNLDGTVNSSDWLIMKDNFFVSENLGDGDLNEDGVINSMDWSIMKSYFWEEV